MPEYLTRKDRRKIESYNKIGQDILLGAVRIDQEKCTGCGLCVGACAAGALKLVDKKARMDEVLPACMSCGDCVAICPEDAIELVEFIQFKHHFRYIDRGKPEPPRRF
jgi:ferredoxin